MEELLKAKNLEFLEIEKRFERAEEINQKNSELIEKQKNQLAEMKDNKKVTNLEEVNRTYEGLIKNKDHELARLQVAFKTSTEKTEVLENLIEEKK